MSLDAEIPNREALTATEWGAFASLPHERPASAELEERVVRALVAGGLLVPASRRRRFAFASRSGARLSVGVAAALAAFAAGIAVGRRSAEAGELPPTATVQVADSVQLGLMVQRAGTEYVHTLQRVAASGDSTDPEAKVGREAARSTLRAAARQFARVAPDDPVAALILERMRAGDEAHAAQRLWF